MTEGYANEQEDCTMARMTRIVWGTHDNRDVYLYTMTNRSGMEVRITTLGGIIVSLTAPDRDGGFADVVLGFDDLDSYKQAHPFFGALVGRYANRIADAAFTLNGTPFHLVPSEGKNQLHGGTQGFDKKVWDSAIVPAQDGDSLALSCFSPDMEQGYPGNLDVTVLYTLTEDNALRIDYQARSDQDTVVNLTNHSYFNLSGHNSGTVLDQVLQIRASAFTVIGEGSLPTGEIRPVEGTPLDFRTPVAIGARIRDEEPQLRMVKGYDHNYCIDADARLPEICAMAKDPASGRVMRVLTDKPGVQLYTGNFLDQVPGKGGCVYPQHGGFCLETQFYPDSVNQSHFPSPVLCAGALYAFTTVYAFSTES
jgi:aldose 1-epimerase